MNNTNNEVFFVLTYTMQMLKHLPDNIITPLALLPIICLTLFGTDNNSVITFQAIKASGYGFT